MATKAFAQQPPAAPAPYPDPAYNAAPGPGPYAAFPHHRPALEEQHQLTEFKDGKIFTIVDIAFSAIWIGLAIFNAVLGAGWPYAIVEITLAASSLGLCVLILAVNQKKRALQFWISWNIIRLLGEIALVIVFYCVSDLKSINKKERDSEPEKERLSKIFLVWALIDTAYLMLYLVTIAYMCEYYRAIKKKEDLTADHN